MTSCARESGGFMRQWQGSPSMITCYWSLAKKLSPLPNRLFVWPAVLVAIATSSVYLSYELVVKPRRALQDQIREQKETIAKLEQDKQRLEAYLRILERIDRRARVEVLRQVKDQQG